MTSWLPRSTLHTGTIRDWDPLTVNEQVLILGPSGQTAQGIALTGLYSALIPVNGDRGGLHRGNYLDRAVVEVVLLEIWGFHRISRFSCTLQKLGRSPLDQKPGILARLFPSRGAVGSGHKHSRPGAFSPCHPSRLPPSATRFFRVLKFSPELGKTR
nr:hypothetical protein [Pseudomonas sp. PGPPP4]